MLWIDYVILAIIGISMLISLFRGFVREAISLLGLIVAVWVAITFTDEASVFVEPYIEAPSLARAACFIGLFLSVLVMTALVNMFAGLVVDKSGLSGTDRVLGMVFGAARGAIFVGVLVLLAGITSMPQDPWWRESALIKHFEILALEIRRLLPSDTGFSFDPRST